MRFGHSWDGAKIRRIGAGPGLGGQAWQACPKILMRLAIFLQDQVVWQEQSSPEKGSIADAGFFSNRRSMNGYKTSYRVWRRRLYRFASHENVGGVWAVYESNMCRHRPAPIQGRWRNDYVTADVRRKIPESLANSIPSDLFNLAAVHVTPGHPDWEYFDTNIRGAVQVCRFASATGCNSIVFTSSISTYGPSERPLDEDSELAPTSAYGRSKMAAEEYRKLWQSEQPAARRLTIVRPAVMYGLMERGNFSETIPFAGARRLYLSRATRHG